MKYRLEELQLKVSNYKSIGDLPQGFDTIKPVNVIVGRNNSGKTALIELIQNAVDRSFALSQGHRGAKASVHGYVPSSREFYDVYLNQKAKQPDPRIHIQFRDFNSWVDLRDWGDANLRGCKIELRLESNNWKVHGILGSESAEELHIHILDCLVRELRKQVIDSPFGDKTISRITAERDIRPEQRAGELAVKPNGEGATNVMARYMLLSGRDPNVIEKTLLDALNDIVRPDMSFRRIGPRELSDSRNEIELHDQYGERVPLSHMGSGVKTVLLVLLNLLVVPKLAQKQASQFVFAFEELENNLHPSLQRRLFRFVRDFVVRENAIVFLTTHSSVVIDLFSNDKKAQLLHVAHDCKSATVITIDSWSGRHSALDDLGVRASDLLQSNGLIWVEGPSDRIYVNKWIEVWSNSELKEGVHYRCVPYGGAVLAHYSAAEPSDEVVNDFISVMQINRKAVVLMDSDKSDPEAPLKDRVNRIVGESKKSGVGAWVTQGREVENYIPLSALRSYSDKPELRAPSEYVDILELLKTELERKSDIDKVDLAHRISKILTKEVGMLPEI